MNRLLLELIRPYPTEAARASLEDFSRKGAWPRFCTLLHWSGLGPLAYKRLRFYPGLVPGDVLNWLRTQYYETIGINLYLLGELDRVVTEFSAAGIDCLVLKGPVLAHLTRGLERVFGDLDLLIKPADMEDAHNLLCAIGYEQVAAEHPYHSRYARTDAAAPVIVEIHFGLQSRDQCFSPNVNAIWDRSAAMSIFGVAARVPDLTDHLLLLMLQLPHHHWSLRLICDIGHLIWRRQENVDWSELLKRAREWRMQALVGSTLYVVGSVLRLTFPRGVWSLLVPESYFRRVQWQIVKAAVAEHLDGRGERISRLARYVVGDRIQDVRSLLAQRAFLTSGDGHRGMAGGLRRLAVGISAFPELGIILLKSAPRMKLVESGMALRPRAG